MTVTYPCRGFIFRIFLVGPAHAYLEWRLLQARGGKSLFNLDASKEHFVHLSPLPSLSLSLSLQVVSDQVTLGIGRLQGPHRFMHSDDRSASASSPT